MATDRRELVNKTEERIANLQGALKKIQTTRQRLNDSSLEVKSKIQSVVSRQLESLRSREVWLLSQVDILEQTKEQVLRTQEDKLHHALGTLSNSLQFCQVDDDGLRINTKLSESLERLDTLELRPLESPFLSFRADVGKLRGAIHEFGRIDSRGLALESVFAQPGETISPSLPHAFEDYGDAEHHVLYKTLADIKRENDKDTSIRVAIPRLTKPNADWLTWTPETTPTPTPTRSGHFTFPPFQDAEGKVSNIQEWLAHIKYETAVEDDEFEVIEPPKDRTCSESSSIELLNPPLLEFSPPEASFPYFEKIKDTPSKVWLEPGRSAEQPIEMLAYFQEAMKSSCQWLSDFQNQMERAELCSAGGCSNKAVEEMVDIENLDKLCCVESPSVFSQISQSNTKLWLALSDDDKDVDETQTLHQACRANEVCNSFSECLCDENCCTSASSSGNSSPCDVSPQHHQSPTHDSFSHIPTKAQMWLSNPKSAAAMEDIHESPLFSYFHTLPTLCQHWLKTSASVSPTSAASTPDKNLFPVFSSNAEPSTWLWPLHSSTTPCDGGVQAMAQPIHEQFRAIQRSPDSAWLKSNSSSPSYTQVEAFDALFSVRLPDENQKWLTDSNVHTNLSFHDTNPHHAIFSPGSTSNDQWLLRPDSTTTSIHNSSNNQPAEKIDPLRCEPGVRVWLQKKSLSVDEIDVQEEEEEKGEASSSVTDSVSDMFTKLGLGLGPWLKPGHHGGFTSPGDVDMEDEENESVWLQKKENSTEKLMGSSDEALFKCFQENQMSKWLSKSSINN